MSYVPYAPAARSVGNPHFDLSTRLGRAVITELRARKSLRKLLDHESYILDDMGLARVDIDWVLTLPLSVDAKAELQRLSNDRRKARL